MMAAVALCLTFHDTHAKQCWHVYARETSSQLLLFDVCSHVRLEWCGGTNVDVEWDAYTTKFKSQAEPQP